MAFLKRLLGTLGALLFAGALIVGIVMILAQQSWNANPLRDQLEAQQLPDDPWVLSEGERTKIAGLLAGAFYNDPTTGELKMIDTSDLSGWTVREPICSYTYTGEALVQDAVWYYPLCYKGTLYLIATAKAHDLPKGTDPVPSADDCQWSWEIILDKSDQLYPDWYALRLAFSAGDNDFAVINTQDYAYLYSNGESRGLKMWENSIHTLGDEPTEFSFDAAYYLLEGIEKADINVAYPLAG